MAIVTIFKKYKCLDDCVQSGCPQHKAELTFNSVVCAYSFNNGKGQIVCFEEGELEAMIDLLKQLGEQRADSLEI